MKILYLGSDSTASTSQHRADALRRLGHEVLHLNPRKALPSGSLIAGLTVRIGFGMFSPLIRRYIIKKTANQDFDLLWVNGGAEISPNIYRMFRSKGVKSVNYQNDDPFGRRDGKKWNLYLASLAEQDLTVVVREPNEHEALSSGAKRVHRVFMSYDPVAHAPVEPTPEERVKFTSEVSFVGTWMPERGPFMARLIELGVPLSIRGGWWQKAPEWESIQSAWQGPPVYGRDYQLAQQCSKISLGLLSAGNRDLHTQRSAEVPYMGGAVFCGQRTVDHKEMYQEGKEAEFWSTPEECAEKCFVLLKDEERRLRMVLAAKQRVEASGLSNDAVMEDILNQL